MVPIIFMNQGHNGHNHQIPSFMVHLLKPIIPGHQLPPRHVLAMESLPSHKARAVAKATAIAMRVARKAVQRARLGLP